MEFVSNLRIQMDWRTTIEEFEERGKNGWKTKKEMVARNITKDITYETKMADSLPSFSGTPTTVKIINDHSQSEQITSIVWTLPYNLAFPNRSKRNRFFEKLDEGIRHSSRMGVIKGDLTIDQCLAMMLEFDINHAYNPGNRKQMSLAAIETKGIYCFVKLFTKEFDIATIWKQPNCSAALLKY